MDHNCVITMCLVIGQYVKGIFLRKKDWFFDILLEKEKLCDPRDTKLRKFLVLCFQAAYEIWSRSEHALGLNYVVLSNLQNPKFNRNPLKISLSKNTSFTYWLLSQHSVTIQSWSIPHLIAYHIQKKMRYRWTKSDEKWRQETQSKTTTNKKKHPVY